MRESVLYIEAKGLNSLTWLYCGIVGSSASLPLMTNFFSNVSRQSQRLVQSQRAASCASAAVLECARCDVFVLSIKAASRMTSSPEWVRTM